ncbi:methyltransferase domain-containing protein [Pseudodesulfovibrio cashew]|uniref:Methyltransferase domain-containing protein n=1 Tax=Pseudodesulfovibrio cashew TaxID=2678688 RepID=A0A6I6JP17_9BACT|nr:class I SAM-dependent methyltransferase [Pseudodesulfovibrio cashew]QGY39364.1 methyltransferase domain-containing protein [Pseudodesulfovibrio cashew]
MSGNGYYSLGHRLPDILAVPLFGARERYGKQPVPDDPDWVKWSSNYAEAIGTNKSFTVSDWVYDAVYKRMTRVDVEGKRVLEIGPGSMDYLRHLKGVPAVMELLDVDVAMLKEAGKAAANRGIPFHCHEVPKEGSPSLPFPSESLDMIISFFSLEHIHPLEPMVAEMARVLKKSGLLVGAIPCEGGLAWGLGRYLTTRRHYRAATDIDFDKVICWEHPNFAEDILRVLDAHLVPQKKIFWPLRLPLPDMNLTVFLHYEKSLAAG